MHFHIHALPSNTDAGNVLWEWKWRWTSIGGVAGAWNTTSALEEMPGVTGVALYYDKNGVSLERFRHINPDTEASAFLLYFNGAENEE